MKGAGKPGKIKRAEGAGQTAAGERTDELLRESADKYRFLIDATSTGYVILDDRGRVVDANQVYVRMTRRDRLEDILGRPVTDWTAPYDLERNAAEVGKCLATGSVRNLELDYVGPDGALVPIEINATVLPGPPARIFTVCRDISERKRAEEALRVSESRTRSIIASIPLGMLQYRLEPDGRLVFTGANPAADRLLGVDSRRFVGRTIEEAFPPLAETEVPHKYREVVKTGMAWRTESIEYQDDLIKGAFAVQAFRTGPDTMVAAFEDSTERKRVEGALKESEARYRMLYEGTPVMMHSISSEGKLISVSNHWLDTLGYTREEVLGRPSTELLDEPSRAYARDVVLPEFMRSGVCTDIPYTFVTKSGARLATLLSAIAERDETGKIVRSLAVIIDITRRQQAEAALRESEEQYRQLFEAESDAIFLIENAGGSVLAANEAAVALYGYSSAELRTLKNSDLSAEPSETQRVTEESPVVRGNAVRIALRYHRKKDGTVFPVEITGRFFEHQGRQVHIAAIRDITDRMQAQEALRKNEQLLETIIETGPDCIKLTDRESCILLMNRAGLVMIGADSIDQVKGQAICPLVAAEHRGAFLALHEKVFAGGSGTLEFSITGLKGRQLWLETFAVPLRGERGEVTALLGVTRDITGRKRAEESLRQSEERFRDLAESLPLAVFELDLHGRFTYVNRAALEKFGYTPEDVATGLTMPQVLAAADRDRALAAMDRRVVGGETGNNEFQGLRKDGSTFPMTVASSAILRDGRPLGLRGIALDLTERKALEAERMKVDKLESVGMLAGGIAHDFNNLLQGVFGYISLTKLEIDDREKALAKLEQTEKALHNAVSLAAQLLTFSKGGKPVKQLIDLGPVIENACRFSLSGSRTDCRLAFDEALWSVEADEGQVAQVIQNIVLNADQAMPNGGTVEIAAKNVPAGNPGLPEGLAPGRYVQLSITDSGVGIPPEYLTKIFDPYFTTKEKGSGLGLATSYSIARNHGGLITVHSTQGAGSTFAVYLPASEERAWKAQVQPAPVPAPSRRGRVLVMDDDAVVLTVAGALLRALGHDAELAAHGEQAVERYREAMAAGRPYDIVILDLTVRGGLGGQETVRRLREIDPGVKAVVSSGYSDDEVTSSFREHGFRAFLKKPYRLEELKSTLNALLD